MGSRVRDLSLQARSRMSKRRGLDGTGLDADDGAAAASGYVSRAAAGMDWRSRSQVQYVGRRVRGKQLRSKGQMDHARLSGSRVLLDAGKRRLQQ